MKKVLGITALLSIFVLSSCKKDYTCECVSTAGASSSSSSSTINGTKKDAKAACDTGDQSVTVLGVTSSVNCEIK